jgi:hypothetical protein
MPIMEATAIFFSANLLRKYLTHICVAVICAAAPTGSSFGVAVKAGGFTIPQGGARIFAQFLLPNEREQNLARWRPILDVKN